MNDDDCNSVAFWNRLAALLPSNVDCTLVDVRPFELLPEDIVMHNDNEKLATPLDELLQKAKLIAARRLRGKSRRNDDADDADDDDADDDSNNADADDEHVDDAPPEQSAPNSKRAKSARSAASSSAAASSAAAATATRRRWRSPIARTATDGTTGYFTSTIRTHEAALLRALLPRWRLQQPLFYSC